MLKNPDKISLETWGNQIIQECKVIAEVLDQANDCALYVDSIEIQSAKIKDAEQTPSAILLSQLIQGGQSFQDLGIALALEHKEKLRDSIAPQISSQLQKDSLASLSKLKQMEQSIEEPFESFLKNYTLVE